jgi:hypothetical protein
VTWLFEEPLPIIFVGIVVEAILAGVFINTRRAVVLIPMLGVLLVVLGLLAIEWAVVTDRERVEATMDGVAEALEANDWDRVRDYCAPDALGTRARVNWAESHVRVTDTSIHNLEIEINRLTSPPTAEATFDGVVAVNVQSGLLIHDRYAARFVVQLHLVGDRWLITDHVEHQPQGL